MTSSIQNDRILISAGGTGGHVFPAIAVADDLVEKGATVVFLTDYRGKKYLEGSGLDYVVLPVSRLSSGGFGYLRLLFTLGISTILALVKAMRFKPTLGLGFGGFPSVPGVIACLIKRVPLMLHEQNAVLGRVQRIFAKFAKTIAVSTQKVKGIQPIFEKKIVHTGMPTRKELSAVRELGYKSEDSNGRITILGLGGSQGAKVIAEELSTAISLLPKELLEKIDLYLQCPDVHKDKIESILSKINIKFEIKSFFSNISTVFAKTQLVVTRSGASTIAELTKTATPAILIPYPTATDNHQVENAVEFSSLGGGWVIEEKDLQATQLARMLERLVRKPAHLVIASDDLLKHSKQDATSLFVEQMIKTKK